MVSELLTTILSTRRGHNSAGELEFLKSLHMTFDSMKNITKKALGEGSIGVEVGTGSTVMFSCHIDTVHSHTESLTNQKIFYDENMDHIFLDKEVKSTCLGADDGAGVYVLLRMISAGVPGFYVFHRGEERGGIGSNATLKEHEALMKRFTQCVAFDRPRDDEIITHQGGQECASLIYAEALAKALNALDKDFKFAPSNRGVFTDSKVYRHVIQECVNIGVGYYNQHSPEEYLDVGHLERLIDACIKIDWAKLPIVRVCPPPYVAPSFQNQKFWRDIDKERDIPAFTKGKPPKKGKGKGKPNSISLAPVEPDLTLFDEYMQMTQSELIDEIGDEEIVGVIVELRLRLAAAEARLGVAETLLGVPSWTM